MKFLHLPLRVEDHRSPEYGEPDWHNGLTIRDKRNICLATVGHVDAAVKDDAEAIANLFAAAPDLFNALEQARAALPDAWAAVKCGVPREVIEIINAALAKAMPVKPRVWKRLDSYSALMVDYHNAIAAVFWNLGPECCWIVFNEPRPAGTCLRGLLATETKASGSVYAKSHKSPDWDTAAEEARTAAAAAL